MTFADCQRVVPGHLVELVAVRLNLMGLTRLKPAVTIAIIGLLTLDIGCTFRVDDCVVGLDFVNSTTGEPIEDACVEFTTTESLGNQTPEEYLDTHSSYRGTAITGGLSVRLSITNTWLTSGTHGVVDPVWLARLTFPDRTETIVFEQLQDGAEGPLLFMDIGNFVGSHSETITVSRVRMIGCGDAIVPLNEGCQALP